MAWKGVLKAPQESLKIQLKLRASDVHMPSEQTFNLVMQSKNVTEDELKTILYFQIFFSDLTKQDLDHSF